MDEITNSTLRMSASAWSDKYLHEEEQNSSPEIKRAMSDTILSVSQQIKKGKRFTYETREFFIPFNESLPFFPYFCSNFVESNLDNFSGEELEGVFNLDQFEGLLNRLRKKIFIPRIMQDFCTMLMIGVFLYAGSSILQYFLMRRNNFMAEEHKKSFHFIWLVCMGFEIILFVLIFIFRALVRYRIDIGLNEESKSSQLNNNIRWQREGKFLKLRIMQHQVERCECPMKAQGAGIPLKRATMTEDYYQKLY